MNERSSGIWGTLLAAMAVGLLYLPEANAGGRGVRGGRAPRPPHFSAGAPGFGAPRMPHAAATGHTNARRGRGRTNPMNSHPAPGSGHAGALATTGKPSASTRAGLNTATTVGGATATGRGLSGGFNSTASAALGSPASALGATLPYTYTYGTGASARGYRAYGFGRGFRNSYYGGRYGYGRNQGYNRAIIARLRAVHMSLARIDHDYQGHRVRAMHAITMAIRQLSHRSMMYGRAGFGAGIQGGPAPAMGRGAGARRGQPMPQAQSDAVMSQALRTLQGIAMQLAGTATTTMGHARAGGHVQEAIRELNTALAIR